MLQASDSVNQTGQQSENQETRKVKNQDINQSKYSSLAIADTY